MIKSKFFWLGAVCLALIPLFALDIPKHVVDLTREFHDEVIDAVYDSYKLSHPQKVEILNHMLSANEQLHAGIYLKSFASFILLVLSFIFFIQYRKREKASFWKPCGITLALVILSGGAKIYSWTTFSGNDHVKLLTVAKTDSTLTQIYNANFKGKVVYVDFWGTTCIPCLEEFRNFTKPLKAKYENRNDIAYLYICGGHQLVWKQQLERYDIAGSHLFFDRNEWSNMYKNAIKGDKDQGIYMPRYLIIDKQGKIVDSNAPRPSDIDSISVKLDKYLALQ